MNRGDVLFGIWIGGSVVAGIALLYLLFAFPWYLHTDEPPFWQQPSQECYPNTEIIYINRTIEKEIPIYHYRCNNPCADIEHIWQKHLSNKTFVSYRQSYELGVDRYNCIDFSQDTNTILSNLSFDSQIVFGKLYGKLHQWNEICLPFEPQDGTFITRSEYETHYEKVKILS